MYGSTLLPSYKKKTKQQGSVSCYNVIVSHFYVIIFKL